MIFGFAGASGTGKTTLGRAVAQAMDLPFHESSITDMGRKAGFDTVAKLTLPEHIELQESLLAQFAELLRSTQGPALMDRTPLDLIIYMMGEIDMHSHERMTPEQSLQVADYVARCRALSDRYFRHIFVTAPLFRYEEAKTRPASNPAYQLHSHLLVSGAIFTMGSMTTAFSILNEQDLDMRIETVTETLTEELDQIEDLRLRARHIH